MTILVRLTIRIVILLPSVINPAAGVFEESSFTFMKWKEGLALMIWYEALASSNSHGSSSTESSVYTLEGYTESEDGIRIEWNLETSDGKTAEFAIDNTSYDLSGVRPNYDSCVAFGKSNQDIENFIESISSEQ